MRREILMGLLHSWVIKPGLRATPPGGLLGPKGCIYEHSSEILPERIGPMANGPGILPGRWGSLPIRTFQQEFCQKNVGVKGVVFANRRRPLFTQRGCSGPHHKFFMGG